MWVFMWIIVETKYMWILINFMGFFVLGYAGAGVKKVGIFD
jgi:hypothetical protein